MIPKKWASYAVFGATLLLVAGASIAAEVARPKGHAADDAAINEKIVSYVREKYGIPDTVKLTVDPFQSSNYPGFLTSTMITDDGKQPKKTNVFLTRDRHYLIVGFLFALSADPKGEIVRHVREQFKVPEATSLTAGPFHNSSFPNFLATTVTAENGKQKQSQDFYITEDNRTLVLGSVLNLGLDLRREALRTIVTTNQPTQGPAHARVTIVEYLGPRVPHVCAAPRIP